MKKRAILVVWPFALVLTGCVGHRHWENAALRMPWPRESPPALTAYAPRDADYPSVGGDILKGASPVELETARAATDPPPAPGPAKTPKAPR